MEKINVAELLKDCPKGMELDCKVFDAKVIYQGLNKRIPTHPIVVQTEHGFEFELTQYGQIHNIVGSKCVIFPRGKTTWEGFQRPFKDGDIIYVRDEYSDATFTYVAILKQIEKGGRIYSHCFYNYEDAEFNIDDYLYDFYSIRFATETEKAKLFDSIKANGYKWNEETKTLDKLIEPKFKVGDKITNGKASITIGYIDDEYYYEIGRNVANRLFIKNQDEWNLVPDKFNINTLKPYQKVLYRQSEDRIWLNSFFGFYDKNAKTHPFICCNGCSFKYCIPYEGNEHLLGKTDDCDDFYKTWE